MAEQTYGESFGAIEERKDIGDEPGDVVRFWLQQLRMAEREGRQWVKRGRRQYAEVERLRPVFP